MILSPFVPRSKRFGKAMGDPSAPNKKPGHPNEMPGSWSLLHFKPLKDSQGYLKE
jgi:hypothetical protein